MLNKEIFQNIKNKTMMSERKLVIVGTLSVINLLTSFLIGGLVVLPQYLDTYKPPTFVPGSCLLTRLNISETRCCETFCSMCTIASSNMDSCTMLQNNQIEGVCNNGSYCCDYGCDTCVRQETESYEYSCNCRWLYLKPIRWYCSTCTGVRTIDTEYNCNCRCRLPINDRACWMGCGICSHVEAEWNLYDAVTDVLIASHVSTTPENFGLNVTIPTVYQNHTRCFYHIDMSTNNVHLLL